MKAALVHAAGQSPTYAACAEPVPQEGEVLVHIGASALSQLARGRASGRHYSASGQFPFIAGIDGAGRLEDGRRVYFVLPTPPGGSFAERTAVPLARCLPLPDALDDAMAAAIANPGMSSWAALTLRARLVAGETVFINGATGAAGRLALRIARHLGARKVIATGRNPAVLASLAVEGADVTISLTQPVEVLQKQLMEVFSGGVDIVLDYLWGRSAELILTAAARAGADTVPLRYVEIGSVSGAEITLPGAVLRSAAIVLMGSGIGSIPLDRLVAATGEMLAAAPAAGLSLDLQRVPLSQIEAVWNSDTGDGRIVFIPD